MKNIFFTILVTLVTGLAGHAQFTGGNGSGDASIGLIGKHLTNWFQTTGSWSTPGNWLDGVVPSMTEDANILAGATLDGSHTYAVLAIASGASVTIPSGKDLTVSGTLTNSNGNGGILIQSGGSLIHSTPDVAATMERVVANADWTMSLDGWHLISSPVENQLLANGGFTADPFDFYAWSETTNSWLNQKDPLNSITAFVPGQGYLAAWDNGGTRVFAGELNVNSVALTNLSKTGSSYYVGYHLLGNPFASALKWNDGNWGLSNVGGVASVWNETAQNYLSLPNPNDIIPANQGFYVQVSDASNSITISAASRSHSTTAFYKDKPVDFLKFTLQSSAGGTFDETFVRLKDDAGSAFDIAYDGHKLFGSANAPQLYTLIQPGEYAAVNTYATSAVPDFIEMGFRPDASATYTLSAETFTFGRQLVLEDRATGITRVLSEGLSYVFTGMPGDAENRFVLHFSPLGTPENSEIDQLLVYSSGENVYINAMSETGGKVTIHSVSGQLVYAGRFLQGITTIGTGGFAPGLYLVNVVIADKSIVRKVVVR